MSRWEYVLGWAICVLFIGCGILLLADAGSNSRDLEDAANTATLMGWPLVVIGFWIATVDRRNRS
jgi:hypothetical protein